MTDIGLCLPKPEKDWKHNIRGQHYANFRNIWP